MPSKQVVQFLFHTYIQHFKLRNIPCESSMGTTAVTDFRSTPSWNLLDYSMETLQYSREADREQGGEGNEQDPEGKS